MGKIILDVERKIFNLVYLPYIGYTAPTEIFYGGSSSGKSVFLSDRCVLDVAGGGHNYLVLRKVANTVRRSTFNEVLKSISKFKLTECFSVNKTDMLITCRNGYQILFGGMDDPEKIKSITSAKGVITDIWFEEATEADPDDIAQLDKRLRGQSKVNKRIILSFNPIYQTHWIYTNYFQGHWDDSRTEYKCAEYCILKTTYRDNKFLTADDITRLENTKDRYYRDVYLDGAWGVLGKVIFTNWHTEDLSDRKFNTYQNGLDFGYSDDPAALCRVHYDRAHMTLYIIDAQYQYGMTNDILAAVVKTMAGRDVVSCDCAEPKSIQELRQYGVSATAVSKGKDSVNFGIQWLQKLQIVIHKTLRECINEFTVYKWREDKNGNALPEPVDKNNHIIDSIRYALEHEMAFVRTVKRDRPSPKRGAI